MIGLQDQPPIKCPQTCGPNVSTVDLLALNLDPICRNAAIGCKQCTLDNSGGMSVNSMVWLRGCTYMCRPATISPSVQSLYGYYCNNSILGALDGSCHGLCKDCVCPQSQDCSKPHPSGVENDITGLYWVLPHYMHLYKHELEYRLTFVVQATCANGVGITSAKCDNSSLPPNAKFTSNAAYNQPRGCEW